MEFDAFYKLATGHYKQFHYFPLAWYDPRRAWRFLILICAGIGLGVLTYGAAVQSLAWMPDDWIDSDGENALVAVCFLFMFLYFATLDLLQQLHDDRLSVPIFEKRRDTLNKRLNELSRHEASTSEFEMENHEWFVAQVDKDYHAGDIDGYAATYLTDISLKIVRLSIAKSGNKESEKSSAK